MSSGDIDNIEYSEEKWQAFVRDNPQAVALISHGFTIDQQHDIPFVGGISLGGTTVYLDRHFPRWWHGLDLGQFIAIHETFEWYCVHKIGMAYTPAHRWANTAEDHAVIAVGEDPKAYNSYIDQFVKGIEHEQLRVVPFDLDLYPYYDDAPMLAKMKACMR